jgi:hypothetical protein
MIKVNGISIMSFYAFISDGSGQDENKKNKSKSGSFQERSLCASERVGCEEPRKRRTGKRRFQVRQVKKTRRKKTPVSKNRGISLRFKESRHVAKQQFEKDKLNGKKEEEKRKEKKAKP